MKTETQDQSVSYTSGSDSDSTLRYRTQHLLRTAILDGDYSAGEKLKERELCELTGASRSILREALVNLEVHGLIVRESYRGYSVAELSARKISEIFELRSLLETQAAELFTERASDLEIDALSLAMKELEQCLVDEDFNLQRMRQTKEQYYHVLFSGCRNEEIRRALGSIIDRVLYLRTKKMVEPSRRKASLDEFRKLTKALIERDQFAARAASIAHLQAAREALLVSLAEQQANTC